MVIMEQVLMLFIVLLAGLIARKLQIFNDEVVDGLSKFVMTITLPALTIAAFQRDYDQQLFNQLMIVLVITFIWHSLCLLLGYLLYRKRPASQRAILWTMTIFSNCGYMGYPVVQATLGAQALIYAVVYNVGFNVFMWTAALSIFTGKMDIKKLFTPGLIAVILGLTLFLAKIHLPVFISSALTMIGGLTTPLSMMLIGVRMDGIKPREVLTPIMGNAAIVRLILLPLLAYGLLKLFNISGLTLNTIFLLVAMPCATIVPMMAERYGGDSRFASRVAFTTTALSLITIPLLSNILGVG